MQDANHLSMDPAQPLLSVVVPMFNEEEGVDLFFNRLIPVLDKLTSDYEIICVDDGSTDRTMQLLVEWRLKDERVKVISLSRNFGKDTALTAGLDFASGKAVVPIDSDLQDPPELIGAMMGKWREGFEVVYARRSDRNSDDMQKRVSANWFYRVHNWLADVTIPDNTGDFRLMDRRVVEVLKHLPEKTRFMKGLFAWIGFKQTGIDYVRETRAAGTSKWRYWKLWNFALDGITGSSTVPLRIWTYFGAFVASLAVMYSMFLIVRALAWGVDVPGFTSLMVGFLLMGAFNIMATGILGEYVGRIYQEVRNRPLYIVRQSEGLAKQTKQTEEKSEWNVRSISA